MTPKPRVASLVFISMKTGLALLAAVSMFAVVGCHHDQDLSAHAQSKSPTAPATPTAPDEPKKEDAGFDLSVKGSDEGHGKAHLSISDGEGGGFKMDLDEMAKSFSMKMGDGKNGIENNVNHAESDLVLPFYTGSTRVLPACMKIGTDKEKVWLEVRTTTDSVQQVYDFYAGKMPNGKRTDSVSRKDGQVTEFELKSEDGGTTVAVEAKVEDGKTQITQVHGVKS